jgi:hypothetical protein
MLSILVFALAQPPIAVEAKPEANSPLVISASVGELVRLKGEGRWEIAPTVTTADIVTTKSGAAFVASAKGVYPLVCFVGDQPASWAVVTVGGESPVTPDPKPPVVPVETFKDRVAKAFAKDGSDKASAVSLSAFYSKPVGQKFAADTTLLTAKDVIAKIRVSSVLDATKLPETRKTIGAEVAKFGPDTVLTVETRAKLVALFAEIESVLDSLSN